MAETTTSIRAAFWSELNAVGRIALVLYFSLWFCHFIPGVPFEWLRGREPAVVHYIVCVMLLMMDVPLAWTAWKTLKRLPSGGKTRRALVGISLFMILVTVLEGRFALVKGDRWLPMTGALLIFTLFLVSMGIGHRRPVAPPPGSSRPFPINP